MPVARLLLATFLLLATEVARAENWPQWRGPAGNSISSESDLPVTWSEESRLAWKTDLPAWGNSTPAVWGDAVFVTTQQEDKLLVLRLNAADGKIVWTKQVGTGTAKRTGAKREEKYHKLHNLASPSPVTDGERVIVHFGTGDLVALDFDGKELWRRNLAEDYGKYTIWWGHANSPVLYGNAVISVCMQDNMEGEQPKLAPSYLVAHNKKTGAVLWHTSRMTKAKAEECDSYTTPLLINSGGQRQLVVMGGNQLDAYDPRNGKQIWYLPGLVGGRTITGPTFAEGMIFATRGMRGDIVAVKPGSGEINRREIVWKEGQSTPDTPCPVIWKDLLFTITDNGIATCFDMASGQRHWRERLKGDYKATPLVAERRVYLLNTDGLCTVISATPRFDKLTENKLDDVTLASPAVSGGRIYIRGQNRLYAVGKR